MHFYSYSIGTLIVVQWYSKKLKVTSSLSTSTYSNSNCPTDRGVGHRKRIKTEEKAKVVASVWGVRIYSSPCRASCFAYKPILNNRMNCTRMI